MVKYRDRWEKANVIKPSELSQVELQDFLEYLSETMTSPDENDPPFDPPWKAFPHITSPYSIGWRMGPGEDYMHAFQAWYECATYEERSSYKQLWPEPYNFKGWFGKMDILYPLK